MRKASLFILSSLLASQLCAAANGETWTNYQGNAAHTGFVDTTINFDAVRTIWTRAIPASKTVSYYIGQPIVTNEAVYIDLKHNGRIGEHKSNQMMALSPSSGEILWKSEFEADEDISPITYDNHKLYLLRSAEKLESQVYIEAYDATSGKKIFSTPSAIKRDMWALQAPVVDHQQVFAGVYHLQISANAINGHQEWKTSEVSGRSTTATITSDYVIRTKNNAITLLNRKTGELVTTITAANNTIDIDSPLIWDESHKTVYGSFSYADQYAYLLSFDIEQRVVKWQLNFPDTGWIGQPVLSDHMMYFTFTPFVYCEGCGKHVVSTLYAVNTVTGKTEWTLTLNAMVVTPPIVTRNAIILQTKDSIQMISRDKQKVMKLIPILGDGHLALANNVLYYTEMTGLSTPGPEERKITAVSLN